MLRIRSTVGEEQKPSPTSGRQVEEGHKSLSTDHGILLTGVPWGFGEIPLEIVAYSYRSTYTLVGPIPGAVP